MTIQIPAQSLFRQQHLLSSILLFEHFRQAVVKVRSELVESRSALAHIRLSSLLAKSSRHILNPFKIRTEGFQVISIFRLNLHFFGQFDGLLAEFFLILAPKTKRRTNNFF